METIEIVAIQLRLKDVLHTEKGDFPVEMLQAYTGGGVKVWVRESGSEGEEEGLTEIIFEDGEAPVTVDRES